MDAGRRYEVRGSVQGVGFRPWVWRLAHDLGVRGRVWNGAAGVTIEAYAREPVLDRFTERLLADPPRAARIDRLTWSPVPPHAAGGFAIVASDPHGARHASIPADLATCDACLAEVRDPNDRRYRYPFTNCTDCGPRFTIAWDVPYDRPATTMAAFRMCPACQEEYDDPNNRRYHAQPNACPACGPQLRLLDADGVPVPGDPLDEAVAALLGGAVVAIKGLGGFHLACDATNDAAVSRLRARKHRECKPFAVMVADLDAARAIGVVDPVGATLLTGVERPITLVPWADPTALAPSVAPEAPRVGLILPYTPLHHLLLAGAGRPLVMTSGNLSGESIAHTLEQARARLGGVADAFLTHDREITVRTDDSVATPLLGGPVLLRRSRGWVPRPIEVRVPFAAPVLAVGAHLKNTCCIGVGDTAWLGPHVGDLDGLDAADAMAEAIERMLRFLDVEPEVIAHDLHSGYLSTWWGRRCEGEHVAVQHHEAHVAAALAEHALSEGIGVAYDGTGLGTDGNAWGAEVLVGRPGALRRRATWRPIPLPGGELAIREPWRVLVAWLSDAFDGELPDVPVLRDVPQTALRVARRQVATGVNAPLAHGMGRRFDALAALLLRRQHAAFEGQLAMALEHLAAGEAAPYPFALDEHGVDDRAMVRAVVADLGARVDPARIAARFHATVVAATAALVARVRVEVGPLPVVLTGGCFVNARLCEGLAAVVHDVRIHRRVPPGDGGLALGQAVIANARRRGD